MKNKKETAPTTEKERENFWLEIGPAAPITAQILTRPRKKTAMPARMAKPGGLKAQSRKKSKINLWQRYDEEG